MSAIQNEAMQEFRNFCCEHNNAEELQEADWFDLAVGYFLGIGFNIKESFDLAGEARYKHKYWEEQWPKT
jgi:hypothetical protein